MTAFATDEIEAPAQLTALDACHAVLLLYDVIDDMLASGEPGARAQYHHKRTEPLASTPAQALRLHEYVAFADEVGTWAWPLIQAGMTWNELSSEYTKERAARSDWMKMPSDVGRNAAWHLMGLFLKHGDEAFEKWRGMPALLGFDKVIFDRSGIDKRRTGARLTKLGWVNFDYSGIDKRTNGRWHWLNSNADRVRGAIVFCDEAGIWQMVGSFERLPAGHMTPPRRERARLTRDNKVLEAVRTVFRGTNAPILTTTHVIAALGEAGLTLTKRELALHLKRFGIETEVARVNGKCMRVLHRKLRSI